MLGVEFGINTTTSFLILEGMFGLNTSCVNLVIMILFFIYHLIYCIKITFKSCLLTKISANAPYSVEKGLEGSEGYFY